MLVVIKSFGGFVLCSLLLSIGWCFGQVDSYKVVNFKRYDSEKGLPSGACGNLYIDSYGYVWVSNYYGVSIFNGTDFFNLPMFNGDPGFNLSQIPHDFLQLDSVTMLIASPTGLYLYDYRKHLVQKSAVQPFPPGRRSLQILGLSPNGQNVFIEAADAVYTLSLSLRLIDSIQYQYNNFKTRVRNTKTGKDFFYVTSANDLVMLDIVQKKRDTILVLPPATKRVVVNGESPGYYLVCADEQVFYIRKNEHKVEGYCLLPAQARHNSGEVVSAVSMDDAGNYWIGGSQQLYVYINAFNRIIDMRSSLLMACRKGEAQVADIQVRGDEIYISTLTASGILVSDRSSSFIRNYDKFADKRLAVFSMALSKNRLFCTGFKNQLNVINTEEPRDSVAPLIVKGLSGASIAQLEILDEDHAWLICWEKFKLGIVNLKNCSGSLPPFQIDSLARTHYQSFNILYPTKDAIPIIRKVDAGRYLYSVNNLLFDVEGSIDKGFRFRFLDSINAPAYITSINLLGEGKKYIGTSSLQVFALQNEKLTPLIDLKNPNIPVRFYFEDSHKLKYLLTTNGIYVSDLNLNLAYTLSVDKGQIPGNIVYAAYMDNRDVLWIATNGGVIAYDCAAKSFFRLSSLRSISNFEFNTKSMAVGEGGQLYFGGLKGVTGINTAQFSRKQGRFDLFFHEIKNQDSVLYRGLLPGDVSASKNFPYYKNNFSFKVHAVTTLQSQPFEIRYMLEGMDTLWRVPQSATIEFMELRPGNYSFRAQGKYPDSNIVKEIRYTFRINDPFWNTLWFKGLMLAAVSTIVYLILQYRHRSRIEQQRMESSRLIAIKTERERISQELHDDLGSGLTSIRLLSKSVSANPGSSRATKMLEDIAKLSDELIDQMSEIIWVLNHSDDSFNGLVAHLRIYMAGYLDRIHLPLKLELTSYVSEDLYLTGTQRRNILLVVKEAFHNTVKHSGASAFSIQCTIGNPGVLSIMIHDNGVGLTSDLPPKGNGLGNISKRILSLKGTTEIKNDGGTLILLRIPINNAQNLL